MPEEKLGAKKETNITDPPRKGYIHLTLLIQQTTAPMRQDDKLQGNQAGAQLPDGSGMLGL